MKRFVCTEFLNGRCQKGSQCEFSHSKKVIGSVRNALASWDSSGGGRPQQQQPPGQTPPGQQSQGPQQSRGKGGQAAVQPVQAPAGQNGTIQWVRTFGGFFTPGAGLASMAGAGPFLNLTGEGLAE